MCHKIHVGHTETRVLEVMNILCVLMFCSYISMYTVVHFAVPRTISLGINLPAMWQKLIPSAVDYSMIGLISGLHALINYSMEQSPF